MVLFQEVTEPSVLTVATDAIPIDDFNLSCNGGMDGTATAAGSGGVSPYTYLWSDNQTGTQANNLAAGTYTVSITDDNGCVQENNITLTEPTPIEYLVNFIDPNCDGFETGLIQVDSVWGGTPSYTYALDEMPFSSTSLYENLSGDNYTVFIQDDNDCVTEVSGTLTPPDIPVLFMGDDLETDLGCDIQIPVTTNSTNLIDIQWTDATETLDCDTCLRPNAMPVDLTEYFLRVTSIDDCVAVDSIRINVNKVRDIFAPTGFSPNGDGFNDRFYLNTNKSVSLIKNIKVFNRWGAVVYEQRDLPPNDLSTGWDGYFNGKLMNTGVYVWIAEIEYLDGVVVRASGDVTLVL